MATSTTEDGGDSSSQWTRIVRKGKGKGKKLARKPQTQPSQPPAAGPVENFRPNGSPQLSLDEIRAEHDKVASKWRATECHEKICKAVKANAASHVDITRAICLGLGAFDPEDGSWVAQRRSHIQLAAFLDIVKSLEMKSNNTIECFYQEPRFSQPDKDFIATLGGKVIESPESYCIIDETTLVFGVHLYRDIWAAALEKSLPGMFVGTGWDVWDESPGADKTADFERIREMDATFDKFAFPQDDQTSFSSTCIYWKKTDNIAEAISRLIIDELKDTEVPANSPSDETGSKATEACP